MNRQGWARRLNAEPARLLFDSGIADDFVVLRGSDKGARTSMLLVSNAGNAIDTVECGS